MKKERRITHALYACWLLLIGGILFSPAAWAQNQTPYAAAATQMVQRLVTNDHALILTQGTSYNLIPYAKIFADGAEKKLETIIGRYFNDYTPQNKSNYFIASPENHKTLWVIVPLLNKTGVSSWAIDLGDYKSGRVSGFSAIDTYEIIGGYQSSYKSEDFSKKETKKLNPTRFIRIDIPAGQPSGQGMLVLKISTEKGQNILNPLRLIPLQSIDSSNQPLPFFMPLSVLIVLFIGFLICLSYLSQKYLILILGAFFIVLIKPYLFPVPLLEGIKATDIEVHESLLTIQNFLLSLSAWVFATLYGLRSGKLPLLIVISLVHFASIGVVITAPSILNASPIGHIGLTTISTICTFLIITLHFKSSDTPKNGLLLLPILYYGSIFIQEMTLSGFLPPMLLTPHLSFFISVLLIPLMLLLLKEANLFFEAEENAKKRKLSPTVEQSLSKLRTAKDQHDYNNLLKVIEHERRQLIEARTRESIRTEEMRKAKEGADEANRAKSAFLAVISHEIRTPMTGIMGMVKMLLETTLTKTQHDYIQTVKESGNAMMALLNDILDFEKIESGKLNLEYIDFDLHRLIMGVATLMNGHATNKGISLNVELDPSTPQYVIGDMARLRQVILNLVGNAIKFTQKGGVTIRINAISNQAKEGDPITYQIYFAIQDTGIGISAEGLKNIFTPFAQADKSISRKFGGSGLGLAISKRLIEAMGSQINIKSKENEGTLFFFTLTLLQGDSKMVEDTSTGSTSVFSAYNGQQNQEQNSLRILTVEDNAITQQVISSLLEKDNHKVISARSGEEAVSYLDMGEKFDLIFTDISMPGMSGIDLAHKIRGMFDPDTASIPLYALTGHTDDEIKKEIEESGMNGFIEKPIDPDILRSIVQKHASGMPTDHQKDPEPSSSSSVPEELEMVAALRDSLGDAQLSELLKGLYIKTEEIIAALKQQSPINLEETYNRAHELKGMSANFGLNTLSTLAKDIELFAKEGRVEEVETLISQLEATYQSGKNIITQYLDLS